jgi:hypothetical protein
MVSVMALMYMMNFSTDTECALRMPSQDLGRNLIELLLDSTLLSYRPRKN